MYPNTENTAIATIKIIPLIATPMINPILTGLQQSVYEVSTGSIKAFAYAETEHILGEVVGGQANKLLKS